MRSRAALGCLLLSLASLPAAAQSSSSGLVLDVKDGRITLDARDVPVAQILDRWARIGGVTVVNGNALASLRVTMRLDAVTQREALALLLRDAGGYIAASRPARSGSGTEIDRILIVPRSTSTPAVPQRAATNSRVTRGDTTPGSDAAAAEFVFTASADTDAAADDRPGEERQTERAGDDRRQSPPPPAMGTSGASQPLVNGLTLDEIRARGVRTGNDPVDPPVDQSRYAREREQREQAIRAQQQAQAEAERTGPFGVKGAAVQPGAVAQQPPAGPPASQTPPASSRP